MAARYLLVCLAFVAFLPATEVDGQVVLREAEEALTLRPGDAVELVVWREEDLCGEFRVDRDGILTLPLVGRYEATTLPWDDLRDRILQDFARELRNPSVILTPLRRVYVLGEVNEPGLLALDPTASLAGAVAMAGGTAEQGDLNKIRVIREGTVILQDVPVERGLADIDIRSGDQIFVGRRGWFDRNSTFLVSALLSVTSIVVTLAR